MKFEPKVGHHFFWAINASRKSGQVDQYIQTETEMEVQTDWNKFTSKIYYKGRELLLNIKTLILYETILS